MSGPVIKRCGCGRTYTMHAWKLLPKVGRYRDFDHVQELRNCVCRSTIAIVKRGRYREPNERTLIRRAAYGGRKGRAARRRLIAMGVVSWPLDRRPR